jgi:hypothetical protein
MSDENNNNGNNYKDLPKKNYEQLKNELNQKIRDQEEYNKKFEQEKKLIIMEMITVLRVIEKKSRNNIIHQITNDFKPIFGRTTITKLVDEEHNPQALLEKAKEKNKQPMMVTTDGTQIQEGDTEGGDDQGGEGSEDDIHAKREKARQGQISKNIKKGSSQMPKMKPTVTGEESLQGDEEEEDEQEEQQGQEQQGQLSQSPQQYQTEEYQPDGRGEEEEEGLISKPTNIVIDDEQQIREIATIIYQGKAIVITVDRNLEVTGIQEGKQVFDPSQVFEQAK